MKFPGKLQKLCWIVTAQHICIVLLLYVYLAATLFSHNFFLFFFLYFCNGLYLKCGTDILWILIVLNKRLIFYTVRHTLTRHYAYPVNSAGLTMFGNEQRAEFVTREMFSHSFDKGGDV